MPVDATFTDRLSRIETSNGFGKVEVKAEPKKKAEKPRKEPRKLERSPIMRFFYLLPLVVIIPTIVGIWYSANFPS